MKKIIFVVSSKSTGTQILDTWKIHGIHYADNETMSNYDFEIQVETGVFPDDFENKRYDADAIVSRGAISMELRRLNLDIPIIEIPISSSDILSAVKSARDKYGNLKVGIVGTKNMLDAAEYILDKKSCLIETYEYHKNTIDVIENNVSRALLDGSKIILCGIRALKYCHENNINGWHIETSTESIWQAITEAKRAAAIFHEERRRAMRFKAILDYTKEGIFSFDNTGKFTMVNQKAAEFLNIDEKEAIGKKINDILPDSKLKLCLESKEEYLNYLVDNETYKINLTKKKLFFGGKNIGFVTTFQDVTSIIDAESRVRAKIQNRGHIAKNTFKNIIGSSKPILDAISKSKIYSKANSNVLLYGKTGTGKELFAQSIHNDSNRSTGPFVAINCAALPENLLESELFGYVDGAFTGASKGGKLGLFELAHKGTLFLDEICEMPIKLQSRLLRAIQEKEIMRLGDDRVIPVDVRIICATNKQLQNLVDEGKFREDLYYRLNVLCVSIPPLSERGNDILVIMKYYLNIHSKMMSKPNPPIISKEAEEIILKYEWKGNVRELRNICERLVVLDTTGKLSKTDVLDALPPFSNTSSNLSNTNPTLVNTSLSSDMKDFEKTRIINALKEAKYNKTEAAKILDISYSTLWRRICDLKIE